MLILTIYVDEPAGHAIGVKEALAMDIEAKYGSGVRVVSVVERGIEQVGLEGFREKKS